MASPSKPTIVLVPGAWHSPSHYTTLLTLLQRAGYPTTSSRLPSVGSPTPLTATAAQDAAFIRDKMLLPLLDSGTDVLLVLHSYGGIGGAAAAKGLSKVEREKEGKQGGIVGLVLFAAFVAREGDSLEQMVGGKLPDWIDTNVPSRMPSYFHILIVYSNLTKSIVEETPLTPTQEVTGVGTVPDPNTPFYGDVPAPLAASATAEMLPQALLSFRTPSPPSAWSDSVYDGCRGYIRCIEDAAIPLVAQKAMVDHSGVEWDVKELKSGHSPQLSMPDKVAELVIGWAKSWTGE